jgi:hypothetical protein
MNLTSLVKKTSDEGRKIIGPAHTGEDILGC